MRSLVRRHLPAGSPGDRSDVSSALESLPADDLRSFVADMLATLDRNARAQVEDALLRRATRNVAGFRPKGPSEAAVAEVQRFVAAAKRAGQASPGEVDDYLRQGVKASLSGDHHAARAIFGALLAPLAEAEIDLGQDEMVEEVLASDLAECLALHAAAVYSTTPLQSRADAVFDALDSLQGITSLQEPIASMERGAGPLPELASFLPLWIARLEREKGPAGDWESDRDLWLREAVARSEGLAGLERLARTGKVPSAVKAWCDAIVAAGDWSKALDAYEDAAELVTSPVWRGVFLDGAALAAQVLGRADITKRLEAAWLAAPSPLRLLRFLTAGDPPPATLKRRAAAALRARSTKSPRHLGVLYLVVGDIPAAAEQLDKAPGLGWSGPDHPGHVLFPTFAWLLGGAPDGTVRGRIAQTIHRSPTFDLELDIGALDAGMGARADKPADPRLPTPTLVQVLLRVRGHEQLSAKDRPAMLAAMKAAAAARVAGVLGEKRRRHYEHAALLVACCAELEGAGPKAVETSEWVAGIRQSWSRFPAFQEELRAALARVRA